MDVADVERESGSGGASTDVNRESSMAFPHLIPAPDFPPISLRLPPEPSVEDMEQPSASFDRRFAPFEAPVTEIASYDQLSYSQLREV